METALRNCRFLSLVVVERVLNHMDQGGRTFLKKKPYEDLICQMFLSFLLGVRCWGLEGFLSSLCLEEFPGSGFFRKLEKAVAVSGVCSGVTEENSGQVPGKSLENFTRIAKCYIF